MEQQIIALINQHIAQLYTEAKNTLLHPDSYTKDVNTEHLLHYFRFLETAFQKPYNRLLSLNGFLGENIGIMSHQMYPLNALKPDVKETITTTSNQVMHLANALDVGDIDPKRTVLCEEEYGLK